MFARPFWTARVEDGWGRATDGWMFGVRRDVRVVEAMSCQGSFGLIDEINTEPRRGAAATARGTRTLREALEGDVEERVVLPAVEIEVPPLVLDHLVSLALHRRSQ